VQGGEPPASGQVPWVANQVMMRFYLPYLQFTHLNNAYHFYAPEPGPVTQVWFRLAYADGSSRWVKLPDHDKAPNGLAKRRWGGLATQTGQLVPTPPPGTPLWERFLRERQEAVRTQGIPLAPIPFPRSNWTIPPQGQYREPNDVAKLLLSSLVRYVARNWPHPTSPEMRVTGVKAYRIDYHNVPPELWAEGLDPRDPTRYLAFYQGEFNPDGTLKPSSYSVTFNADGERVNPSKDGLLYWLIPIRREPVRPDDEESELRLVNYLRIHAGDKGEEGIP
jgi:hypothetical protein